MASATEAEVLPGLVVHLDTDELRRLGGSSTNAETSAGQDRAVAGPHYFLIVSASADQCVAVPLFSRYAPGSERLQEQLKFGLPDKWRGEDSYFSKWQHWHIPISCVAAASGTEESSAQDRRGYAANRPEVLAAIESWQDKNRAPYRAL